MLPRSLRNHWEQELLPDWAAEAIGFPAGATIGSIDVDWPTDVKTAERLSNYLVWLVESRRDSIGPLVIVDQPWPAGAFVDDVSWRTRTKNCLLSSGFARRLGSLQQITYAEMFRVRGMGTRSVLDFACSLDAMLGVYRESEGNRSGRAKSERENSESNVGYEAHQAEVSNALVEVLDETWADWVSEKDLRFSELLPAGRGTITERIDELTSSPETPFAKLDELARSVLLVRGRVEELSKLTLEAALHDYVGRLSRQSGARLEAILARAHWDGSPRRKTGQETASELGVTRQRIQQLEARTWGDGPQHPVVMPALDRALALLEAEVPISASAAATLLQSRRITSRPFHPTSLLKVAEVCKRTPAFKIENVFDKEILVALPERNDSAQVLRIAQLQASQAGASNIHQVAERLERDGIHLSEAAIDQTLRLYGRIEFLGEGWFCFPDRQNDAIWKISRRMLSVTSSLSLSSIREGIKKVFRFRKSSAPRRSLPLVPPRQVLAGYYRVHSDFVIAADGSVRSVNLLDYRAELPISEQVMVMVLRAAPAGVLDRSTFGEECMERGLHPGSFWTLATYSPILERLGSSLWTLRGTLVDPAAVEAIRRENALRPRHERVVDFGWTSEGLLWVAIRLPPSSDSMVFRIPNAVERYLWGRDFPATTEDGVDCGNVRVYPNGMSAGYARFLNAVGADEGDILFARFSLSDTKVVLSIIDDEELEEISPDL